jgi:uncharacterized repeat protein (TIGR01451 family)
LMAGESVTYTVTAEDAYANTWDVSDNTDFTIEAGAGGFWLGNIYTSQTAGDWTVTGEHEILTDTATLHVTPRAGLSVTKTDSPDPATVGNTLIYTVTITNFGPSDATGVTLTDTLPAAVTLGSANTSQGDCNGTSTITCDLGDVGNAATASVTIVVTPTVVGTITNRVSVTQIEPDSNMADNTAEESTTINNPVPTMTGISPDSAIEGSPDFTLTISGTNFVNGSTVHWDGLTLPTTFVSSTQLTATVTAAEVATAGTISVTVVNPAPGGGPSNTYIFTIISLTPPHGTIYLPLILKSTTPPTTRDLGPDLVVDRITISSNSVQIVIRNQGDTPVIDPFWVDLYIDPNPPPTGVNQIWNSLSSHGAVWGVVAPALPLEPGESFNLTYDDTYYWKSYSNISWPLSEGTPVYVQVDSANANTTYGGVLENHEMDGGAYNNISGPVLSTLNTMGERPTETKSPANHPSASDSHLPSRP